MTLAGKRLTLSFDNGPFPDVTPGVLDTLAARALPASFFVVGRDLESPAKRELVERAHAAGVPLLVDGAEVTGQTKAIKNESNPQWQDEVVLRLPRGTTRPFSSTILHSTCGCTRPTVETRRSKGSLSEVWNETGLVSVMP